MPIVYPGHFQIKREIENGSDSQRTTVKNIISQVKAKGDEALFLFTEQLDGAKLDILQVSEEEIEAAFAEVDEEFVEALREAAQRIRHYHEKQKQNSWFDPEADGTILGQLIQPLEKVGIYVPGGSAAYPSSVLMNAIPAQVAGVGEIVMTTPPQANGSIYAPTLVAARIAGVDTIFKVGGAQAIAALAFGTPSIPAVDKVVGPGNIYVALAKQEVYGQVDIDSIAGPSEIVVIADETANPIYVAADLLSQAEHDPMSSAVLLTPSVTLAEQVAIHLEKQCAQLPRKVIAQSALQDYGAICLTKDVEEAITISNRLAPEHLELMVAEPWNYLSKVKHAGAVFLGANSPEPIGDYFAGPNHVLPTHGTARFFSALDVSHFMKKTSVISYSREALMRDGQKVIKLAQAEGLDAHANSIQVRLAED
ncbi:histidinol dehydrogenase [Hazenella coriacea]|uniref:histidinol dehydrogenase n=1 Tax=Hazenella coriacea TaxID=1179467 RepID=UPI003C771F19